MILFPAIDLKDGKCVRLKLGEMDSATVYNESPSRQALDGRGPTGPGGFTEVTLLSPARRTP